MKNENCTLSPGDRPYEKCLRFGAASLTDAELLAVIIRSGTRGTDSVHLAEKILKLSGAARIAGLGRLTLPELTSLSGVGEKKAIQILAVGELAKRIASERAMSSERFPDPASVADYFMERLRHDDQENVYCVMLDAKNRYLGEERISRGTATASLISSREIFMAALRMRAVGIILVHNHPSGDPTPSEADRNITSKVAGAASLMDINLLDHIIIGDRCYVSFRDNRLL